jgi:glucokinase
MHICVDLGGSKTRVAVLRDASSPTYEQVARFPTELDFETQIARLSALLRELGPCAGIGVCVGAQVTRDGDCVDVSYTSLRDYSNKPLASRLARETGQRVALADDNVGAVLAERRFGELGRWDRVAYLTVSTGTGAGIFLKQGSTEIAFLGQIGHTIIDPAGPLCSCGQRGCVQATSGGHNIRVRTGKEAWEIDDSAFWDEVLGALATGIVNLARVARVEAVCVGGGMGVNVPQLKQLPAAIARIGAPAVRPHVLFAALGEDAPLIGARELLVNTAVVMH